MERRTVVLGVTGSIAAYKAVDLASRLTQAGVTVSVVMTESATKLVTPATFRAITHNSVATAMFDGTSPASIEHVSLAEAADLLVIAPATANVIAKLACGIADDLLTCTALATRAPILVAPAMHAAMYEHPATQENLRRLQERGVSVIGPVFGRLASGTTGRGRFAPVEEILEAILRRLRTEGDLQGRRVVVTAGGTREPIDPVRFVGNRSSGKMGHALARGARDRGATVVLIDAATTDPPPAGMELVKVQTADEMLDAVRKAVDGADALLMAAAVADYRPASPSASKLKKGAERLTLDLVRTPDVLAEVKGGFVRVGFAAESEDLVRNARAKRTAKGLDLIVANDIATPGSGFEADENRAVLIGADGEEKLPLLAKSALADRILDRVVELLNKK